MLKEHEVLFRRLKEIKDYWSDTALESLSEESDLSWSNCEKEYLFLRKAISTEEGKKAYSNTIDELMRGLIHSILVMFDGGDELTDEFNIDIINADTKKSLLEKISLHEEFIDYIFDAEKNK
ncbi:hypothetical protein MSSIH_1695 [Methanosarcina siciliae HI350]|uniref:Uncharacterized protein n=1 Tax=Methanosarcina siciliae HI350 TaxID=1434119 RepID=A0A0E3PE59_9EURY|nr:histidine kinase [Methanosarcina siciliae]AKB32385.1 hypothetical protein MSSIH_1695 [Methanosarcina siciliae HI350]